MREEFRLQIADWIITKHDPLLGWCQSLDDFHDSEAVRAACSPLIAIEELDFLPSQEEIEALVADAEAIQDPWRQLPKRQRAFLFAYLLHGGILPAANGLCYPASPYEWSRESGEFARAFEDARRLVHDRLVYRAFVSALHGDRVPSYNRGRPVLSERDQAQIYITRPNPQLLRFLISRPPSDPVA